MTPLEWIKTYANLIIGAAIVIFVLSVVIYIKVLKMENTKLTAQLATASQVITGYAQASKVAEENRQTLIARAEEVGIQDARVIEALKQKLPTTDEEARQFAIQAGQQIGGLQ